MYIYRIYFVLLIVFDTGSTGNGRSGPCCCRLVSHCYIPGSQICSTGEQPFSAFIILLSETLLTSQSSDIGIFFFFFFRRSLKEGDVRVQEEMLKNQNKSISGAASKNIFKLIWGG